MYTTMETPLKQTNIISNWLVICYLNIRFVVAITAKILRSYRNFPVKDLEKKFILP